MEDPELCRSFRFRLKKVAGRSAGRLKTSASSPEAPEAPDAPEAALNSSVEESTAEEPPEMFRSCGIKRRKGMNRSRKKKSKRKKKMKKKR